jgi:hypothetical protein
VSGKYDGRETVGKLVIKHYNFDNTNIKYHESRSHRAKAVKVANKVSRRNRLLRNLTRESKSLKYDASAHNKENNFHSTNLHKSRQLKANLIKAVAIETNDSFTKAYNPIRYSSNKGNQKAVLKVPTLRYPEFHLYFPLLLLSISDSLL